MLTCWKEIAALLKEVEATAAYYIGGTLCLPYGKGREVAMNLDGTGFVLNANRSYPHMKNDRVHVPPQVTELVRKVYLKHKGFNQHYSETVCGEEKILA